MTSHDVPTADGGATEKPARQRTVRIALAGGGTAGHISPLVATAEQLRTFDGVQVTALGTERGLETRLVPAAGVSLELIESGPLPRKIGPDLVALPYRLLRWISSAKRTLRRLGTDVVVGYGGYVSTPVYLAARQLKLPILIHEQNAVPGIANKLGARSALTVYTTFPGTDLGSTTELIGLPVRSEIATLDRAAARGPARERFGLRADLPVLLVSGGSQGAAAINDAIIGAKDALLAAGVQVLHVLGPDKLTTEHQPSTNDETGAGYHPVGYIDKMHEAYAAADLMVGRSGAGTVVETAIVGLPTVLVPFPHGNGEQVRNAEALVQAGGARLIENSAFTRTWVEAEVIPLVTSPELLAQMSEAAQSGTPGDAAQVLARAAVAAAR